MLLTLLSKVGKLSSSEQVYLLMYPEHIKFIESAAQNALNESTARFGRSTHNGQGDAFRHCFWSAMLCRDIGYVNALRYTSAHEAFDENPPIEKAMDLHNNAVGLQLGRAPGPNEILVLRSLGAPRAGMLKVIE